jgi:hypothetical protein
MKHQKYPQPQNFTPPGSLQPASATALNSEATDFTPSPDEVARRAYFTYVNQGSQDGHEVQHWLQAEAELIAERQRTRVHGFHHQK